MNKTEKLKMAYEEIKKWVKLEAEMKKELQVMAEADEAVVSMLMQINLPQELHNEIAHSLEKMRKEFDELENKYYDLKIKKGDKNNGKTYEGE